MLIIASNAKRAPRCGVMAAGVDPPNYLANGRWLTSLHCVPADPGAATPDCGHSSFRALLRDSRQKCANLSLPVPAVTAESPDRRELACLRPPGHCLRVNPEHCCNFCRREQWLSLGCTC